MKNNLYYLILFFSVIPFMVYSQTINEIKSRKDIYLYGEGRGESLKTADNAALAELVSQISTTVHNDFTYTEYDKTSDNTSHSVTELTSIINTYSQATLTNTERIILQNEPDAYVFRYIRKSEIDRIFESRKNKIIDLVNIAGTAREKTQIDDALRYYYWAYVLLKSMRYPNEIKYIDTNNKEVLLITWLPLQINQIFSDLSVSFSGFNAYNKKIAELAFYYQNQPVQSLDYSYFDGIDWSNLYTAREGIGIIELRPNSIQQIQLKFEYEFYGESHIDKEIGEVMKVTKEDVFRKAFYTIDLNKSSSPPKEAESLTTTQAKAYSSIETNKEIYHPTINRICEAIIHKQYDKAENDFTSEGYDIFRKLIQYGNASLVGNKEISYMDTGDEVYCRNLLMSFSFKNSNRKFVENVTFTFNRDRKINNITFGLGERALEDILHNPVWNETSKLILIQFLENYKTAYALKRLDYIESIFSEDALIITGRIVTNNNTGREGMVLSNRYVEFIRQNKSTYMRRLKQTFQGNEFININFANNEIMKMGKGGELYAIQIKQDYFSSNYGDTGYLFLMVDLNSPKEPLIHVRTWQPEKDPQFGLIGPGHF